MQRTSDHPTTAPETADGLAESALRAEAWAGEPFLREGEDPARVLAPQTARRIALDAALKEIEEGQRSPSSEWRTRFGLMLGLERVLSERPPRLASGTELRRHQIDALAGMLTELIAANQKGFLEALNGNGTVTAEELTEVEVEENGEAIEAELDVEPESENGVAQKPDPGAVRRFRFRHPTASGKTIAAAGFVEAARTVGVLILTHRRLLVSQFNRELGEEGYGDRIVPAIEGGQKPPRDNPVTIQTYAWFARHVGDLSRDAYQLVICDEAHTALGEKTSAAIRSFPEPIFIGMTATEQLIAKQVSDVFPASVDDLPLADATRRGLVAPLRNLRVPPVAAIHSVPIVGGDFDEGALAQALDHQALNQAAASLYRDRFENTPGIVYAAGVEHAYNLAQEFRAAGLKAEAVSGRTPPVKLAETLAAYERGEINVLINAMLLAEGWNSPRATVVMHLAPTASRRVYQQRIGRIMRIHPRKEAGVVVDFVPKSATHNERVITLHSLLDADFYREGARVLPSPRRRYQRRARRKLTPATWLVPVTPDVRRRLGVITREWQRIDPKFLDEDEQRYWATIAGRQIGFDERVEFAKKLAEGRASKVCLEQFLYTCAAENPNRRLRLTALQDRAIDEGRARGLRRPGDARDLGADVGEGPARRHPHPPPRARRGEGGRAGADPLPLDLEARARFAQSAGPPRQLRVPGGQAASRRPGQLAGSPSRGERRQARLRLARATSQRRRRIAGLGRGVHAARESADRRSARADRAPPGGCERACGQSPRAEDLFRPLPPETPSPPRPRAQGPGDAGRAERRRTTGRQRGCNNRSAFRDRIDSTWV